MGAPPVLQFLEKLTGIEGLIPDPYFGGAGPHQIEPGGFLKIHADFNWHPLLKLDRRLNLIVYLNRDWREEYGGHIELWDRGMTRAEQKVLPVWNRTIVFNTTDFSYHGHPTPLACPAGMTRKSVSFYYYSNGRPAEERSAPHDTLFRKTHEHEW
jgi:Rps23 Pro-64 3,4-dihydroxylase Tpa1-like proline 4-hydroxylase